MKKIAELGLIITFNRLDIVYVVGKEIIYLSEE